MFHHKLINGTSLVVVCVYEDFSDDPALLVSGCHQFQTVQLCQLWVVFDTSLVSLVLISLVSAVGRHIFLVQVSLVSAAGSHPNGMFLLLHQTTAYKTKLSVLAPHMASIYPYE